MLVAAVATSFAGSPAFGSVGGIGGYSGNPAVNSGQTCALCHFGGPASTATIIDDVTGMPASSTVVSGATRHFRFRITGGAGSKCGFDLSATGGTLSPSAGDVKHAASPAGELTHNGAKIFSAGVCEFGFDWQAPVVGSTTFLMFYGAGNSADGSGFADFDSITTDTHSITVNPPTPPALSCTTSSLSPSVTQGQNAGDEGFSCSNPGGGSLSYSISPDAYWLSVAPPGASGLGSGESQNHTVSYTTAALAPGNYVGTITVSGGAAGTELIVANLTVSPVIGGPPPNDDWQNAVIVSPSGDHFEGTLVDATPDGSDSLGLSTGRGDVWYVYTAESAGFVHADTCGTNDLIGTDVGTDTILSLHLGAPGTALNQLDANDDFPSSLAPMACDGIDQGQTRDSAVAAFVDAGDSVYVRVTSNQFGGSAGSFALDLTPEPEPTLLVLGAVAALAWLARRGARGSGAGCARRRRNG
jgi:hypothetical protein